MDQRELDRLLAEARAKWPEIMVPQEQIDRMRTELARYATVHKIIRDALRAVR